MSSQHRHFYINDKLEFSLFFDPAIKDKEKIIEDFTKDNLWKWYCTLHEIKLKSYKFSADMLRVDITTK